MTPEEAKDASQVRLSLAGIPVNPNLPLLDSFPDLTPRSACEVASRAFTMSYIVGISFGDSASETLERIRKDGLEEHLTPNEKIFLTKSSYSEQDRNWAYWHGESVLSCAWAMNLIVFDPFKDAPDNLADLFWGELVVPKNQIALASLRPFNEIYQEADFHYRLHWAVRSWRAHDLPFEISELLVAARRRAFDWIIGVPEEWDDVSLDT